MANKKQFPWLGSALLTGTAAFIAYKYSFGPWLRRWGTRPEEQTASLPGDELVPAAQFRTTRAVSIQAAPDAVWPWIVQIGQGRGGFYSYDILENLMGLQIHSSREILPQYQAPQAGDMIPLDPSGFGYTIHEAIPDNYLLLYTDGSEAYETGRVFKSIGLKSTWLFLLRPQPGGSTRLICRWLACMDPASSLYAWMISIGIEPIEFMMERKMLLGIKERAEKLMK